MRKKARRQRGAPYPATFCHLFVSQTSWQPIDRIMARRCAWIGMFPTQLLKA